MHDDSKHKQPTRVTKRQLKPQEEQIFGPQSVCPLTALISKWSGQWDYVNIHKSLRQTETTEESFLHIFYSNFSSVFIVWQCLSPSVVMLTAISSISMCLCFETYKSLCGPWQNQSKTHEGILQIQTLSRYHSLWSCTCTDLSSHSVHLNFSYSCICITLFFVNTLSKCESQIAQEYECNISEVCKSIKRIRTSRWPKRRADECWWAKSGLFLW